jgi:hypothetical protein
MLTNFTQAYVPRSKKEAVPSPPQDKFSPLGYLWIDALCIDQKNIPERNTQVAIMRDIYKSSQRIIIWLGLACKCHVYFAMDAYTHYVNQYQDKYHSQDWSRFPRTEIPDEVIEAIDCLSARDWWSRSWIVQEASTPDVPKEVWCGHKRVSWEALEFVQRLLWDIAAEEQAMIPPGRNECLEYLNKLAEARRGDTTTSLLDLLVEGRKFEATDPRDKIYAFLGIHADTHGTASLPVDYSLPASKVYQQAAIHILETSDNLDLLLNCGSFRKQATPTWVPDWSISGSHHSILRKNCNASGDRSRQLTFEDGKNLLILRGVHWDIVTDIVPRLLPPTVEIPPEDHTDFVLKSPQFLEWVRAIAKLAYRDGEDGQYPIPGLSITGALSLLFQFIPSANTDLVSNPLYLSSLPFLEVLNGGSIGSNFFNVSAGVYMVHRRVTSLCVFRTERGYLGFGNEAITPGDAVTILYGLNSPVILRREPAAWQLLGPCFGVDIMLDEGTCQNPPEEDFRIE